MNNRLSVKFLSLLLAVMMLFGTFAATVYAAPEDETIDAEAADAEASGEEPADTEVTDGEEADGEAVDGETVDGEEADGEETGGEAADGEEAEEEEENYDPNAKKAAAYLTTKYNSPAEKLATMECMVPDNGTGYELWCDSFSGEVALVNTVTGQTLFTNPYDIGSSTASADVKGELMSQLMIEFSDNTGTATPYNSFNWSTQKGQIKVKNIKNGIRVEYSIGEEETRYLVPMVIEKSRFEELIVGTAEENNIPSYLFKKLSFFYVLQDPESEELTDAERADMYKNYPITEKMAVYVFDTTAERREKKDIEGIIKKYCPKYTYAKMEEDHQITNYISTAEAPPLFKMALEYYLDEEGLKIKLPANGVRFDEDKYTLNYIRVLPYFGAGNGTNNGYVFVPDGSGALLDFKQMDAEGVIVGMSGDVYGTDYAYHEIVTTNLEEMRVPVYGVVENFVPAVEEEEAGDEATDGETAEGETAEGETAEGEAAEDETAEDETAEAEDAEAVEEETTETTEDETAETEDSTDETAEDKVVIPAEEEDRGFLAIIEEGDSLATIKTSHGGSTHTYNSAYPEFYLRATDSYNLSDAVSVGDDTVWTITADRRYTGSYGLRIVMLTDDEKAAKAGMSEDEYYETSYVGMAKAYQDYLVDNEVLTFMEETSEDIPLYIESFGTMDTDGTFLSVPITVTKALTTFSDLKKMQKELSKEGIKNINFKLTGFANGGMISDVPTKVEFQKEVGGDEGYTEFIKYAEENGVTVYPDFDLSYASHDKSFDGFSMKKDATRTIDNRYQQKREYYSSFQQTITTGLVCISPSVFSDLYGGVTEDLTELGKSAISLGTLGSDLNSDFDEDDTYNREDGKELIVALLEQANKDYDSVMVNGGNAFTWKYADTILNMALDSSRHSNSFRSVPFMGMVLHGCIEYAGSPTNMASDMNYEVLKMIENGALPYFTLSYDNTEMLKDDSSLSKYYSVDYQIWKEDLVEIYNDLNVILRDLQSCTIVNHEFLVGERLVEETFVTDTVVPEEAPETEAAEGETIEGEAAEGEAVEGETTAASSGHIVSDGTIVRITYSNGTQFILNYNRFDVTVDGETIEAVSYIMK